MKRKKIDTGKVKALRKAGWTIKAIADEMGCSFQNVSQILKKENNEDESKSDH